LLLIYIMGNTINMIKKKDHSILNTDINIEDYSKVKIPKDCTMIKLGSLDVNLKNTINLDYKIKEIVSYITNNEKKKQLDIINLQGFYDTQSLHILIKELKQYFLKYKLKFYFAPEFANIEPNKNTSISGASPRKMIEISFHSSGFKKSNSTNMLNKKMITNIIISKFPILGTIYSELDDKTDMDDILGIHSINGANILINNHIISVYNTYLCKDIKIANIINSHVRMTEIQTLNETINKNKKDLINNTIYEKHIKTDIHLIVGMININELDDEGVNKEYIDFIAEYKCVDIFRYMYPKNSGFTTIYKERINYVLLQLTDDVYDDKGEFYKNFQEVTSSMQLFDSIFKRYGVYFLDVYTITSSNGCALLYYPVECIFIMKGAHPMCLSSPTI
jgi:hypothetical protein